MEPVIKTKTDWTDEQIAAFWDWQSNYPARNQQYFTAVMAPGIVRFLSSRKLLRGNVLDYGCGAGHLLEALLQVPSLQCYGIDFSAASVLKTKERTAPYTRLQELFLADELPVALPGEHFDLITLVETIEHLRDDMLDNSFRELFRLLKPGGRVFITTPFNESLEEHLSYCPFCNSAFHHMQHLQRFTAESLSRLANRHGFQTDFCRNMDMERFRLGRFRFHAKRFLLKWAAAAGLADERNNLTPNLVAIISKP